MKVHRMMDYIHKAQLFLLRNHLNVESKHFLEAVVWKQLLLFGCQLMINRQVIKRIHIQCLKKRLHLLRNNIGTGKVGKSFQWLVSNWTKIKVQRRRTLNRLMRNENSQVIRTKRYQALSKGIIKVSLLMDKILLKAWYQGWMKMNLEIEPILSLYSIYYANFNQDINKLTI